MKEEEPKLITSMKPYIRDRALLLARIIINFQKYDDITQHGENTFGFSHEREKDGKSIKTFEPAPNFKAGMVKCFDSVVDDLLKEGEEKLVKEITHNLTTPEEKTPIPEVFKKEAA